jgi:hypothetical protein
MNPIEFWTQAWRGSAVMFDTAAKAAETLTASRFVIDQRSRIIEAAAHDPLSGNHRELNRMVPEKVIAFSKSHASAAADLESIRRLTFANFSQATAIAMKGRAPVPAEASQMAARAMEIASLSVNAAAKALAPIHRTATGNARRLSRKERRP